MHACPRCLDSRLRERRDGTDPGALVCRACHGVWLTAAAAQGVLPARFGPLAELPTVPTGFAALRCPECRGELVRRRVAGVEIDVCDRHGGWFDHREVERIRAAAHHDDGAALAIGIGVATVAAAVPFTQSPAPPAMNASAADLGTVVEGGAIVVDVALTSADVAAAASEVGGVGLEVVDVGEVAGGAFDVLAGIFDGLLSL
jgi:Zn-finger nucleic acid-binding protein